jgi:hypothetical protein
MIVLVLVVALGLGLVMVTLGKSNEWNPPLARFIRLRGWRDQPPARERVRTAGYLAAAFGVLGLILSIWFPGR